MQGYRGGGSSGSSWPYSPISPHTPGPGTVQTHTPVGDRSWMDSQGSGKGKSPEGRRGINKGEGTKISLQMHLPERLVGGGGPSLGGGKGGKGVRGSTGGDQPRVEIGRRLVT